MKYPVNASHSFYNSSWFIFINIIFVYVVIVILSEYIIYNRSYSDALSSQSVEALFEVQSRFWWIRYLATPLIVLTKFLFVSTCISIGKMLTNAEIKFKEIFNTVMIAESVFISCPSKCT